MMASCHPQQMRGDKITARGDKRNATRSMRVDSLGLLLK